MSCRIDECKRVASEALDQVFEDFLNQALPSPVAKCKESRPRNSGHVATEAQNHKRQIDHEKARQAEAMVRRLRKENAERERRKKQAALAEAEAVRREIDQQRKRAEEEARDRFRQKMNDLERRRLAREQKSFERHRQFEELRRKEMENVKQDSLPMYKRMEKEYEKEIVLPEIEKRKQKLKNLHEKFLPMQVEELEAHAISYNHHKLQQEKSPTKRKTPRSIEKQYYTGRVHEEVRHEQMKKKQDEVDAKQRKIDQLKRREKYGDIVREMYMPDIDVNKVREIEDRIHKLKNPVQLKKSPTKAKSAPKSKLKHVKTPRNQHDLVHSPIKPVAETSDIPVEDEAQLTEMYSDIIATRIAALSHHTD